ncbi:Eco57I restriction-modification methylase domain-containing protein [Rhizobiaceae bacterium BDR2-2]|uniref:site-specific DNA-methyltransferase (adenine-specific) n=1 Tax=Ectorhizobium quercum TaxID=2965071 RepID=A0AAE3N0K1_9HYPH|nr:Eco57I restriction-modification methylase domain-containing protein [Ectorhizobium quercum]MCX8997666.1 Eco57I restriction-modification methylase domain-containing protein [Ectorhizobium quercum]
MVNELTELVEVSRRIAPALIQADTARREVSPTLDPKQRSKLGQFMTPAPVASFMAGMFDRLPKSIRLLDAGAGVGSLTAAFVREAISRKDRPRSIDVTTFEVDPLLGQHLAETLIACAEECEEAGIAFTSRIVADDYILHSAEPLLSEHSEAEQYDCAILNPPYAKINTGSKARKALSTMGIETTNLYTAFVAVALDQLKPGGQLVAITPRSFCNGSYFEPFRRFMLEHSALRKIHVYESRKQAFKDDEVLQENIIYQLIKSEPQPATVRISLSHSPQDLDASARDVQFADVVLPNDPHVFIRLAVSAEDGDLALRVQALPCTLRDLGVTVSTGRVVDFRARDFLRKDPEPGSVPLIYPCHFNGGYVSWPKPGAKKPNALVSNDETAALMVPCGTYVLTKRFSSKEEKRRLVAVVYDPVRIDAEVVGFENHLNYFHLNGEGLPGDLARGLALFLNSTAVDQYFRQFSGHTQVNATDLRNLHYPTVKQLEEAGRHFGKVLPEQEKIDAIVEALL